VSLYTRNSLSVVSQLRNNLPNLRAYDPGPRTQFSLAQVPLKIISSEAVPGEAYQWKYTVKPARFSFATAEWDTVALEDFPYAYNGWEAENTATSVLALSGESPADLPTGFTVDPLPDGLVSLGTVQYFKDADADIVGQFVFYLINEPNPIGGTCP